MKRLIGILIIAFLMQHCDKGLRQSSQQTAEEEPFISELKDGKYTTDFSTAQELKSLRNTIENFTQLNKKKFENLKAYQEFGDLIQMQADRVASYSNLDSDTKKLLLSKMDKIRNEVATLQGEDMEKSKLAVRNINSYLVKIDSSFSYNN